MTELAALAFLAAFVLMLVLLAAFTSPDCAPRFYAQGNGEPAPEQIYGGTWKLLRFETHHDETITLYANEGLLSKERAS